MPRPAPKTTKRSKSALAGEYEALLADVAAVVEGARRGAARSVNAIMTTTYWLIGERIVEREQGGLARAEYGEQVLKRLAGDLSKRFGRGFSERNLEQMRTFYLSWPISQAVPAKSLPAVGAGGAREKSQAPPAKSLEASGAIQPRFPLPWTHYVRLMAVRDEGGRAFYEAEALRGGWTSRQLDRQIQSQYYQRTALSRDKAAVLRKGSIALPVDLVTPEEELKDPYVLEFLALRDEYSESELEAALVAKLESFLLELGGDFTFAGRQRRLRVGDEWYRVDLLFFHRRLRCLVIVDLKLGKFTHADAGQMHLYLNYAREHWMLPGENPPVGLILCAEKDHAVAKYALDGLPNKVLAAEYRTALPEEQVFVEELTRTRRQIEARPKIEQRRSKRPTSNSE
jgi:predicted nuclease of restriction endonuclease-like (RecB) superfamily